MTRYWDHGSVGQRHAIKATNNSGSLHYDAPYGADFIYMDIKPTFRSVSTKPLALPREGTEELILRD